MRDRPPSRLQVRLPEGLYWRLLRASELQNRSLNAQIVWMLTDSMGEVEDEIKHKLRLSELPPLDGEGVGAGVTYVDHSRD